MSCQMYEILVFEDEIIRLAKEFGDKTTVEELIKHDHSIVRFYLPLESRWDNIKKQTTGLGQYLTDAVRSIAKENLKLQGVIDIVDFNATAAGQRIITDVLTGNFFNEIMGLEMFMH